MSGRTLPKEPSANMIEAAYPVLEQMPRGTPARDREIVRAIYQAMWEIAPKPSPGQGLTRLQRVVQSYLADYIDEHGYPPTYQSIADNCVKGGKSQVWRLLISLEKRGVVYRAEGFRGIRLLIRPGELMPPKKKPLKKN